MSPTAPSSPMTSCHSTLWLTGWAKIFFSVSRWLLLRSGAGMQLPPVRVLLRDPMAGQDGLLLGGGEAAVERGLAAGAVPGQDVGRGGEQGGGGQAGRAGPGRAALLGRPVGPDQGEQAGRQVRRDRDEVDFGAGRPGAGADEAGQRG